MIPKKAEELPVNQAITERFMCVTDGEVELKLISGVFSQNMYQGVFEDLSAEQIPEDVNLYKIDKEKYPLLEQVSSYIQTVKLQKSDCIYIPAFFFMQIRSLADLSITCGFYYDSSSKLT